MTFLDRNLRTEKLTEFCLFRYFQHNVSHTRIRGVSTGPLSESVIVTSLLTLHFTLTVKAVLKFGSP